jgi:hypothetical protein
MDNMVKKVKIEVYMLPEILEMLEAKRGLVPRSTYVEDLIKKALVA